MKESYDVECTSTPPSEHVIVMHHEKCTNKRGIIRVHLTFNPINPLSLAEEIRDEEVRDAKPERDLTGMRLSFTSFKDRRCPRQDPEQSHAKPLQAWGPQCQIEEKLVQAANQIILEAYSLSGP